MRRLSCLFVWFCVVVSAVPSSADNEICRLILIDATVENGVGAEAGVVREFTQDLDVPGACQSQGGNAWILGHHLTVTRLNAGSSTMTAEVAVRQLDPSNGSLPSRLLIERGPAEVSSVPVYPIAGEGFFSFGGVPRAGPADAIGPTVFLDGDLSPNQFVTVDQSTGTPLRTCWTQGGGSGWELCTNGNPNIRGIGLGLQVSPTIADFRNLDPGFRILTDIPNGAGNINVDFSGNSPAINLVNAVQVVDPVNPIPLCTSPGQFPFQCYLTPEERDKLNRSELVILIEPKIIPPLRREVIYVEAPLISADHYIFSNGFESGDDSFWSTANP